MNTFDTNFVEKAVSENYVRNNQNIFCISVSNESSMKGIKITLHRTVADSSKYMNLKCLIKYLLKCFRLKYLIYVEHKIRKGLMN